MPACVHARSHVCLQASVASGCSFSLCQCNVYISGESSINFLRVETRSYGCICVLMYVYMYNCGDAVLSGCAVTAHLYKWLFWSGILSLDHTYSLQTGEPTTHTRTHTHAQPDRMKTLCYCVQQFLHVPISLACLVGSGGIIVYACVCVCACARSSFSPHSELFCLIFSCFSKTHIVSFQLRYPTFTFFKTIIKWHWLYLMLGNSCSNFFQCTTFGS